MRSRHPIRSRMREYGHNTKALQKVAPAELEALGISGDPSTFLANNLLGPMPEEQRSG